MKILSTEQIRAHDAFTIRHEPITSIELMERAATRLSDAITTLIPLGRGIQVLCGVGNNGGDGLACARLLIQRGYNVRVAVVRFSAKTSPDFDTNLAWLREMGISPVDIVGTDDIPTLSDQDVIIDAIFGSGLTRPVPELCAEVIDRINLSRAQVIAIDLPSGLVADAHSTGAIVQATHTLTLQHPKLAFFMPENAQCVGEWQVIDIGLHREYYRETVASNEYTSEDDVRLIYRERNRFSHKGSFGHSLMITGSKGMMGASILTTRAALRAGSGLVTAYVPQCGYEIMQESVPEAMALTSPDQDVISGLPPLEKFDCIGIGPGMGTEQPTREMIALLLNHWKKPMVIDADALNIIALEHWLDRMPPNAILTPHPGEFKRLFGEVSNDFEMLEKQRDHSVRHKIYIVLKRAYTCVTFPDGTAHFNSSGSPALATGGSGDVLTGVITGLLAQHYSPAEASLLGVWLHGKAGELAGEKASDEAVIAGDIIDNLGGAFTLLRNSVIG